MGYPAFPTRKTVGKDRGLEWLELVQELELELELERVQERGQELRERELALDFVLELELEFEIDFELEFELDFEIECPYELWFDKADASLEHTPCADPVFPCAWKTLVQGLATEARPSCTCQTQTCAEWHDGQ